MTYHKIIYEKKLTKRHNLKRNKTKESASLNILKPKNDMMVTNNKWIFPESIKLEVVPFYSTIFDKRTKDSTIYFDLSQTREVHTAFVGFLIHCKHLADENKQKIVITTSPELKQTLTMLEADKYLLTEPVDTISISA